jgi:CRISPR/Cas system endoribonuclease Cas6 (RAMP superfamily)
VGLLGELLVECNAPALWLLRCAKLVGLGSDTSRGFGRVRLEDA